MKKRSNYLTAEETAALIGLPMSPNWERIAKAQEEIIEAAWREMPDDLQKLRAEHGCYLAGAVHALRARCGK